MIYNNNDGSKIDVTEFFKAVEETVQKEGKFIYIRNGKYIADGEKKEKVNTADVIDLANNILVQFGHKLNKDQLESLNKLYEKHIELKESESKPNSFLKQIGKKLQGKEVLTSDNIKDAHNNVTSYIARLEAIKFVQEDCQKLLDIKDFKEYLEDFDFIKAVAEINSDVLFLGNSDDPEEKVQAENPLEPLMKGDRGAELFLAAFNAPGANRQLVVAKAVECLGEDTEKLDTLIVDLIMCAGEMGIKHDSQPLKDIITAYPKAIKFTNSENNTQLINDLISNQPAKFIPLLIFMESIEEQVPEKEGPLIEVEGVKNKPPEKELTFSNHILDIKKIRDCVVTTIFEEENVALLEFLPPLLKCTNLRNEIRDLIRSDVGLIELCEQNNKLWNNSTFHNLLVDVIDTQTLNDIQKSPFLNLPNNENFINKVKEKIFNKFIIGGMDAYLKIFEGIPKT